MKTIDRYVFAVSERLPESMREDIKKELYANIEDMLPENPTEEEIRAVLEGFGDPVKLANEYSGAKRYLIGPEMYDSYISVLKLVTSITTIVFVILAVFAKAVKPSVGEGLINIPVEIASAAIGAAIEGAMQGFLWVTLVFVILERTGVNEGKLPFIKKKWSVDDLHEEPVINKRKISRVETAFGMFFTIFFLLILCFQPNAIGIYGPGENGIRLIEPLIMSDRLAYYIPIIIIIAFMGFGIQIWKFISMQWNIPLAVANTIYNAAVCILFFIMIGDSSLINSDFTSSLAEVTKIPLSTFGSAWDVSVRIAIGILVLLSIWDSISGFLRSRKLA